MRRQEEVDPGAEADETKPSSSFDDITLAGVGDDTARHQPCDLFYEYLALIGGDP